MGNINVTLDCDTMSTQMIACQQLFPTHQVSCLMSISCFAPAALVTSRIL